jgi:hypothetical protein
MTTSRRLSVDTTVSHTSGLVAADMGGQTVIMSIENGKYYSLDGIGSRIWELIGKPCTVRDLVTALLAEYEVEEERCQDNVLVFLNKMIDDGLITVG